MSAQLFLFFMYLFGGVAQAQQIVGREVEKHRCASEIIQTRLIFSVFQIDFSLSHADGTAEIRL